jgi:hypothetical protein
MRALFRIEDINGEAIVVDGAWIDKLDWGGNSKAHLPASTYGGTDVKETSRRKKIIFGEKEELLQVIVKTRPVLSLMVRADQRSEVDTLIAELEKAKGAAG